MNHLPGETLGFLKLIKDREIKHGGNGYATVMFRLGGVWQLFYKQLNNVVAAFQQNV